MSNGVPDFSEFSRNMKDRAPAERWLAAIVESSDDAILGMTLSGLITSWNAAATRIFGYELLEIMGKPVSILAWPGEEERIELFLETLRRGERIDHYEVTRKHKNGNKLVVSVSYSPIIDQSGVIIGIAKIARDITERKEAAGALEASNLRVNLLTEQEANIRAEMLAERRFREMIENAPDAIVQVNTAGAIVIANRTAETMFGYTREELMGNGVDILVPEANRAGHAGHRKAFAAAGLARPMGLGLDLLAQRKDGTRFPVEISLSPMKTENGVHVTAVIRDVTERKLTEQRVRTLQESYMTELEARHKEAERLNHLKSEFMASISHELRTPLHTIIGFAELLQEEGEGPLNPKQKRFLQHIHVDSEHLLGLINDVLDLSRIDPRRTPGHFQHRFRRDFQKTASPPTAGGTSRTGGGEPPDRRAATRSRRGSRTCRPRSRGTPDEAAMINQRVPAPARPHLKAVALRLTRLRARTLLARVPGALLP